ncbi:33187_t:CDS:1, partial [Gigaspora margarita]
EIITKLNEWLYIIENKKIIENKSDIVHESDIKSASDIKKEIIVENESENRIRKQFLENDEISKTLPMITEKLSDIYTSKPYNISEIHTRLSKIY